MKQKMSIFLALVLLISFVGTMPALANLDDNGDTGGTSPGGTGGFNSYWFGGVWSGMRITVIDVTDPARLIGGEQWGKVAAGTVSIDITAMTTSNDFFTRTLAGDNETPLTHGNRVTHFGKVSKMEYRDGTALAATTANYTFRTVSGCPVVLGNNQASTQTIKNFINNQNMLTNIAAWCGGGLTYQTLISGDYKLLVEPIMYVLVQGNKFAFTPTEAAMYRPFASNTNFINNTLANAFFLEHNELGWPAWTGATNVQQSFDTIISSLGMHIYSISPTDHTPTPSPTPTPPQLPPPPPPAQNGNLQIIKVEHGTNNRLDGAEFEITRTSHWESRLTVPNPDDEWPAYVWEWIEVHQVEYVGTYSTVGGVVSLNVLPGSFIVREVTPPAGYILDDNNVKHIDVPREGTSYTPTLTFQNKKLPGLIIRKYDEDTGLPLAGAQFSVARMGGAIVHESITPANGTITLTDLPEGWYTITEMAAPHGYLIRDEYKNVFLPAGETVEVKFDNRRKPTLEILKVDSQNQQPLSGATFRVWKTEGATVGEFVTGADGKIIISNLDEAIYSIEEIAAPDGYLLDPQHKDILLEWGKVQQLVFQNVRKPGLTITKYDEATGEPLANAEFSVAVKGGSIIFEGQTDANGKINLSDLTEGWYTITETAAPFGYLIVTAARDIFLEGGSMVDVRFANRRRPTLEIIKLDAQTRQPLAGATFRVWETEGSTIGEFTTDANGRILIPNLDEIIYSVEEISAPDGYVLDPQRREVRLEWGRTRTLTFSNFRKPTLTVRKYDELTNLPLAGATFRIWRTEGETWSETQITGTDGIITWTGLDPGIYSVQEIDEPYGYFADPSRKEILLNGGDNKQLAFFNRPRPTLTIFKRDIITQEPIEGVRFRVQRLEGETIGEFLTDANGMIELSPQTGFLLNEQIYRVTEIQPPAQYLLDAVNVRDALLKWYEPTEIIFENLLMPTLIFIKTNALTGRGIDNATYRVDYEAPGGGIVNVGTYRTRCGLILLPYVQPGWYIITEIMPAPGFSLPSNPVTRVFLSPGENSYSYAQTRINLYTDPRTSPNSGNRGHCGDWCGHLCSVLCGSNCGMSLFGGMTITNGNGQPLGTLPSTPVTPPPDPTPTPDPSPTPSDPPAIIGGGVVFLNPDFPGITITFGN
jgi:RNase P/RNase MRP subunit p29